MELRADQLRTAFGFGVAGNFAGHLEQAGEAGDFVSVEAEDEAPKGIFPWYAPGSGSFLETFPLSKDRLTWPSGAQEPVNLQIEPEVGLVCAADYGSDGTVTALRPRALGAFNDCSIRRPGAPKISHKKNWGPDSKGLSGTLLEIDDLSADGPTASLRLASFLRRDGVATAYGIDSPLPAYSFYGDRLLTWMCERLNHQAGADGTPLEDVGALLRTAGCPDTIVVGIGATRYTAFGEKTFLRPGDEAIVVVYDGVSTTPGELEGAVADSSLDGLADASILRQVVHAG